MRSRFGSARERRHRRANALYQFEMVLREEGLSDLLYDEKQDLFRFADGSLLVVAWWVRWFGG